MTFSSFTRQLSPALRGDFFSGFSRFISVPGICPIQEYYPLCPAAEKHTNHGNNYLTAHQFYWQ
jgi:hypothetical protein